MREVGVLVVGHEVRDVLKFHYGESGQVVGQSVTGKNYRLQLRAPQKGDYWVEVPEELYTQVLARLNG